MPELINFPFSIVICSENGHPCLVAKGTHDGVGVIGKYHAGYHTCYFPYGGREHEYSPSRCEVLVDVQH